MTIKIFVHTPFQVICAAEFLAAREHLDPVLQQGDFDLILVPTGDVNWNQTKTTAERLGLKFRSLGGNRPLTLAGKLQKMYDFRNELRALTERDVLVIGNPGLNIFVNALGRLNGEQWVLDDGLMTVHYLQTLAAGNEGGYQIEETLSSRVIERLLLGPRRRPDWRSIRWYTIFARYFPELPKVYQNELKDLRNKSIVHAVREDQVYFLGSPLVTGRIVSDSVYNVLCKEAANELRHRYPGCLLVYLCHRGEGERESAVHHYFDIVRQSTGPVELTWLGGEEGFPRSVGGIMSTALISLSELLPDDAMVHAFWPAHEVQFIDKQIAPDQLLAVFDMAYRFGKLDVKVLRGRK